MWSRTPASVGYFGKVPSHGDFVSSRIERDIKQNLDRWLQTVIDGSKKTLDQVWLESYLNAPVWKFAAGAGLLGPSPTLGVILPSVDRVGRYFPFCALISVPPDQFANSSFETVNSFLVRVEELLLSVMDDDFSLEILDYNLSNLHFPNNKPHVLPALPSLQEPVASFTEALREISSAPVSAWWSDGTDIRKPAFITCENLPSSAEYAVLLHDPLSSRFQPEYDLWKQVLKEGIHHHDNGNASGVERFSNGMQAAWQTNSGTLLTPNHHWANLDAGMNFMGLADGTFGDKSHPMISRYLLRSVLDSLDPATGTAMANTLVKAFEGQADFLKQVLALDTLQSTTPSYAALMMHSECFHLAWSGFFNAYLLRGGELFNLTIDAHKTTAQKTEETTLKLHAHRAFSLSGNLKPRDIFLILSGVKPSHITETDILYAASNPVENAAQYLIECCLVRGAQQNITVGIVYS